MGLDPQPGYGRLRDQGGHLNLEDGWISMGIYISKVMTLPVVMMRPSGMFDVGICMLLHLDIGKVNLSRG
jgi:hypothetical protein